MSPPWYLRAAGLAAAACLAAVVVAAAPPPPAGWRPRTADWAANPYPKPGDWGADRPGYPRGVYLHGVTARAGEKLANPVVYDNDFWTDVPDAAYLWAEASRGRCDLRGNVVTRCTYGWETGYAHTLAEQIEEAARLHKAAADSGLRHIPEPVVGSTAVLRKPASGKVEDTKFERTKGSELVVAEARKAAPGRPLLCSAAGCARRWRRPT